jgi:hypothetical protein
VQDVIDTLAEHEDRISMPHNDRVTGEFTNCAKRWAGHCLETYTGDLLRKGLAVAQALTEFECEMMGHADGKQP